MLHNIPAQEKHAKITIAALTIILMQLAAATKIIDKGSRVQGVKGSRVYSFLDLSSKDLIRALGSLLISDISFWRSLNASFSI